MLMALQRRLVIPVWAAAFCALAVSAPQVPVPPGVTLVAAVIAGAVPAAIILWAGKRVRMLSRATSGSEADALDLGRLDDDGGWHMAPQLR
jgi:hypothetical protein